MANENILPFAERIADEFQKFGTLLNFIEYTITGPHPVGPVSITCQRKAGATPAEVVDVQARALLTIREMATTGVCSTHDLIEIIDAVFERYPHTEFEPDDETDLTTDVA